MRIVVLAALFLLAVSFGMAQNRDYSIEIELDNIAIDKNADEEIVTVAITNNSDEVLETKGLGQIEFEFAKCGPGEVDSHFCRGLFARYVAQANIPVVKISENDRFQFRINLVKLSWNSPKILCGTCNWAKPSIRRIPRDNINFFAKTRLLTGYKNTETTNPDGSKKTGREPVYSFTYSNVIDAVLY